MTEPAKKEFRSLDLIFLTVLISKTSIPKPYLGGKNNALLHNFSPISSKLFILLFLPYFQDDCSNSAIHFNFYRIIKNCEVI